MKAHPDFNHCTVMYVNIFLAEAEIASEAYIYFYPILVDMYASYHVGIWPHTSDYVSVNNFVHSYIVEWSNSSATDPCLDILYSRAYLDLENPLVLNIYQISLRRYVCALENKGIGNLKHDSFASQLAYC